MRVFEKGIVNLIFKILILMVISALVIATYNRMYLRIALYEKNAEFSIAKFNNVPKEIEICNFGNSLGVDAFDDYSGLDNNCFNFALSAQSLSYDYRIFQQYRDYISKDAVVFITLYYYCFSIDEEKENGFLSKNERYYYFLKPEYIKEFSSTEYAFIRTFPVLWQSPTTLIQKAEAYYRNKKSIPEDSYVDFQKSAEEIYSGRTVIGSDGDLIINNEELEALYGMIKLCRDIGAKPVLVITPYRKEYTSLFNQEFYDQFYALLDDICYREDCMLLDLSHDERFCNNDDCFADAYHLSQQGSEKFVGIIKSEIIDGLK